MTRKEIEHMVYMHACIVAELRYPMRMRRDALRNLATLEGELRRLEAAEAYAEICERAERNGF